jgi:hypothetical protein
MISWIADKIRQTRQDKIWTSCNKEDGKRKEKTRQEQNGNLFIAKRDSIPNLVLLTRKFFKCISVFSVISHMKMIALVSGNDSLHQTFAFDAQFGRFLMHFV